MWARCLKTFLPEGVVEERRGDLSPARPCLVRGRARAEQSRISTIGGSIFRDCRDDACRCVGYEVASATIKEVRMVSSVTSMS